MDTVAFILSNRPSVLAVNAVFISLGVIILFVLLLCAFLIGRSQRRQRGPHDVLALHPTAPIKIIFARRGEEQSVLIKGIKNYLTQLSRGYPAIHIEEEQDECRAAAPDHIPDEGEPGIGSVDEGPGVHGDANSGTAIDYVRLGEL